MKKNQAHTRGMLRIQYSNKSVLSLTAKAFRWDGHTLQQSYSTIEYLIFPMCISFNKLWIKFLWNFPIIPSNLLNMYESNTKCFISSIQHKMHKLRHPQIINVDINLHDLHHFKWTTVYNILATRHTRSKETCEKNHLKGLLNYHAYD